LSALQFTDRTIHQEFGSLANICQRRFQFMRHMSQKSVLFLGQFQQAAAQPFQLRRQPLQIRRPAMAMGREKVPRPSSLMARSMARMGRPNR
jgi:hypothetical protein